MKTVSLLRLAVAALAAGACSMLFADQAALAAAIQETRTETIKTHNALVANLKALDALVNQKQGDLRPAFEAFTASLKDTRAAADVTAARVALVRESGEKHFATWQAEVQTIKDDSVRTRALKRLDAARKNWTATAAALEGATKQFPELLGYLTDIEKALNYDLTADGVKSVRGSAQSALFTFGKIQDHVQKAVGELDQMLADMSSTLKAG